MEKRRLKIVFTNLNNTLIADGARLLSARLKEMGHSVRMIFMAQQEKQHYSEKALDQFAELSRDADLVLFSFLSDSFMRAGRMTRYLRERLSMPFIWGGLHTTIEPDASMEYVDILCRGEGDLALPELVARMAEGRPYHDVENFWFRNNGEIIRNPMRPLLQDLDSNPWPDYGPEDHFVRDTDDAIKPMNDELLFKYHNMAPLGFPHYCVGASRGCAYHCAYCYNAVYKEMFRGQRRLRFRSLKNVVDEIRHMLDRFPFLRSFAFSDDDFFLRPIKQLEEFTELLHQKLPEVLERSFWGACASPHSLNRKKLHLLHASGLKFVELGVQTGSERLNREVYNRHFSNDILYEKAGWLDREFHKKLIMSLDIMVCGPHENQEDTYQTVNLMLHFPSWFVFTIFKYVYYPGSAIYRRALKEGLIPPGPEAYDSRHFFAVNNKDLNYITQLVILVGCARNLLPLPLFRLLASKPARWIGKHLPKWVLNLVPWNKIFFKLWEWNMKKIYRQSEIKHH